MGFVFLKDFLIVEWRIGWRCRVDVGGLDILDWIYGVSGGL